MNIRFLQFTFLGFLFAAFQAKGAVITVCASGCTTTTVTLAMGLTFTALGDTIELQGNVVDQVNLASGVKGAVIQGKTGAEILSSSGNAGTAVFKFTNTQPQDLLIRNLVIDHTSGGYQTIFFNSITGVARITFQNCTLKNSGGNDVIQFGGITQVTNHVVFDRCTFDGSNRTAGYGLTDTQASGVANSIILKNCLFLGFSNTGLNEVNTATGKYQVLNCGFHNNATALKMNAPGGVQNNLFTANTADLLIAGSGSAAGISYCGFATQSSLAGFGANNVTGIVATSE